MKDKKENTKNAQNKCSDEVKPGEGNLAPSSSNLKTISETKLLFDCNEQNKNQKLLRNTLIVTGEPEELVFSSVESLCNNRSHFSFVSKDAILKRMENAPEGDKKSVTKINDIYATMNAKYFQNRENTGDQEIKLEYKDMCSLFKAFLIEFHGECLLKGNQGV